MNLVGENVNVVLFVSTPKIVGCELIKPHNVPSDCQLTEKGFKLHLQFTFIFLVIGSI
jgi:hypothetical protein